MVTARSVCILLLAHLLGFAALPVVGADAADREWTLMLDGFFPYKDRMSPLLIYARETGGQWGVAVGSSRDPYKQGNVKKTYNRSWYCGDLSEAAIVNGRMKGRITMHMTPDLWIPKGGKSYTIVFDVDAKMDSGKMIGNYRVVEINSEVERNHGFGHKGAIKGESKPFTPRDLPAECTLRCQMQGALIGGSPDTIGRCMIVDLGLENGKLTSLIFGSLGRSSSAEGLAPVEIGDSVVEADRDGFTAQVTVPSTTLDIVPCDYVYEMTGRFLNHVIVGTYQLTAKAEGQDDVVIDGSFDGRVAAGITHYETAADDRPWFTTTPDFKTVRPGEHPRLLFRKSDLPALRKKMNTPEGQAILKRLRYLLDGADGETMTTVFSTATHAYMGDAYKNTVLKKPGVFTIGHVAGYGLLYQLTGDKKYAEFGRQCFEKSLAGVRDRDDRYSFRGPGGPLRAGPSLGWHAVGYDLCYDGWDKVTREKFGRAIAEYAESSSTDKEKKKSTLEALTRGTMPPASNHFGMQIGGAALALLAVDGEAFVDQKRIDRLLLVCQDSTIRNLRDGFGDGGFFKEGDGTGSMSSQIAFVTALQAWQNAQGRDFMGKHSQWGTVKDGPTRHWSTSPRGQTSSLTFADGTCIAVDFTGASGADTMLVTTGKAEGQQVKVGDQTLTFYFPAADTPPKATVAGDTTVVGKQKIRLTDGNLVLAAKGK